MAEFFRIFNDVFLADEKRKMYERIKINRRRIRERVLKARLRRERLLKREGK